MKKPLALLFALHLTACGALGFGEALTAANTIVRGACGAILADTSPEDALNALQEAQKRIMADVAKLARQNTDPAVVAALEAGQEANSAALRETAKQILALAARPAPCPVVVASADAGAD